MAFLQTLSGLPGVLLLTFSVLLVLTNILLSKGQKNKESMPPGPPGEPLLGHFRVIPTENPEYAYMRWSKEYKSDILSFNVLGQPVIVLNSIRAAIDLLDKRGANYCDRPRFVLFEVMGWDRTLTFLQWGPAFRLHRRIMQKALSKSSIIQFRSLQEREAAVMVRGVLDKPEDWESILRRFAVSVILGISYGINIDRADHPLLKVAADASYALGHGGAPAGTPVDFFPFMKSLPSFCHDWSLKFARDWRWAIDNIHNKPYDMIIASNERAESLVHTMLGQRQAHIDKGEKPEISIDDIKGAGGAVYAAGQDTTWATLTVFVLNMVLHPEVQAKAQKEIDEVVGRDRLPTFEDRPKLQYIDYVVQETFRWCPVSPVGIPHRSLKDDTYKGYFVPAGSFIFANARAMTHDERIHRNPDEFDPHRYISVEDGGRGEPYPLGNFGFGRRICVGKHLAEANIWIVVVSLLATMNILKATDEEGNEIVPVVELTNGLTSHPKKFPCRIVPRDDKSVDLIRQGRA